MDYGMLKNGTDIRGVALDLDPTQKVDLSESCARDFGRAYARFVRKMTGKDRISVALGRDSRLSGPALEKALSEGLTEAGADVVLTGLSSTPAMFMILKETDLADASVMITASHLPANRNGFKFFLPSGGLESGQLDELIRMAETKEAASSERGRITSYDFMPVYARSLAEKVRAATGLPKPLAGLHIIVDAGNGSGGFYARDVLEALGADTEGSQFLDPDGRFPNHIPNPENKEAMDSVCKQVAATHADFGIIFDTDVDRAAVVGEGGVPINRNRLIALISAVLLSERPGTIVTDSVTSDGLTEFIEKHGGVHHRFMRGYKNVINESKRLNASGVYSPLAIETSGHAALRENYFLDDGAYLVTKLLILLSRMKAKGSSVLEIIKDLPEPAEACEIRPVFKDPEKAHGLGEQIIQDFESYTSKLPYCRAAGSNYEGFRVNLDKDHGDGWLLLRMSLHEPIMPINFESRTNGGCEKIKSFLFGFLKNYPDLDISPFL
ncbi:MAG: phosphomannomutase/phosphoglucomutase [Clostridia bacterium]|nr:phosphomannomutase/phosphoglucomutase [Clostridia bacterium]